MRGSQHSCVCGRFFIQTPRIWCFLREMRGNARGKEKALCPCSGLVNIQIPFSAAGKEGRTVGGQEEEEAGEEGEEG